MDVNLPGCSRQPGRYLAGTRWVAPSRSDFEQFSSGKTNENEWILTCFFIARKLNSVYTVFILGSLIPYYFFISIIGKSVVVSSNPAIPGDPSGFIWYTIVQEVPNPDFPDFPSYTHANSTIFIDQTGGASEDIELNALLAHLDAQFENKIWAVNPSPDGRYFVLSRSSEPGAVPYVLDRSSGSIKNPLAGYAPGRFLGWHPDSQRFLFYVDGGGPWLVNAETSEITQLVYAGHIQGAAISPDGSTIAYIDETQGPTQGALWFVSSAGSDAQQQSETGPGALLYPSAWSPDGTKLVYFGACGADISQGDLCVYDVQADKRWAVTMPRFYGGGIVWSPDSRHITATNVVTVDGQCSEIARTELEKEACAFDQGRIIYSVDVYNNSAQQLVSGYAPVWSPDGSLLAFLSNRSRATEVWITDANGTGLEQLTKDGLEKMIYLLWTPGGTK
jgi:hypothetical protein